MFLDIGVGILLAIFTAKVFHVPLTASFLLGGVIFSLLMDADHIFHLGKKGESRSVRNLRNLLHYPLLYIPVGVILISFFNVTYAMLFGFCSLAHFIHDSIGIGWGVQWLYPFKKDHYSFFYLYQPRHKERLPKKIIYIWKHEEIDALDEKYGDAHWVKNIYLHWHPYAIIEFLVFVAALIVLYFNIK